MQISSILMIPYPSICLSTGDDTGLSLCVTSMLNLKIYRGGLGFVPPVQSCDLPVKTLAPRKIDICSGMTDTLYHLNYPWPTHPVKLV